MRRFFLLLLATVLLVGCSSSDGGSGFSTDDIDFAEMMIPHHEQALTMSELALINTENDEVRALAEQIGDAQEPEIAQMSSWPGVNPSTHAGHQMAGMLSAEEIETLRIARGEEFDRLFLQGMIKHHQGAIDMANTVLESANSEVATLAALIVEAQSDEVSLMEDLLSRL